MQPGQPMTNLAAPQAIVSQAQVQTVQPGVVPKPANQQQPETQITTAMQPGQLAVKADTYLEEANSAGKSATPAVKADTYLEEVNSAEKSAIPELEMATVVGINELEIATVVEIVKNDDSSSKVNQNSIWNWNLPTKVVYEL